MFRGMLAGGVSIDRATVNVAVQVAPEPAVQVAALLRADEPFMNWTVPVGAAPALLAPVTVAVNVTLPPEEMELVLAVSVVVVLTSAGAFTVMVRAPDVEA